MKPSGDFSRYYCFDHETDFDSRKDALKHLVKVHEKTKEEAIAKLDEIDEMYDEMETFDDDIQ
jgi:hypothetical protein